MKWTDWTIEIKVWKAAVALFVLAILVMWFRVVHQDDEILALVRNEVVTDASGRRIWARRACSWAPSATRGNSAIS